MCKALIGFMVLLLSFFLRLFCEHYPLLNIVNNIVNDEILEQIHNKCGSPIFS